MLRTCYLMNLQASNQGSIAIIASQLLTLIAEISHRPVHLSSRGMNGALISRESTTMPDVHSTICSQQDIIEVCDILFQMKHLQGHFSMIVSSLHAYIKPNAEAESCAWPDTCLCCDLPVL